MDQQQYANDDFQFVDIDDLKQQEKNDNNHNNEINNVNEQKQTHKQQIIIKLNNVQNNMQLKANQLEKQKQNLKELKKQQQIIKLNIIQNNQNAHIIDKNQQLINKIQNLHHNIEINQNKNQLQNTQLSQKIQSQKPIQISSKKRTFKFLNRKQRASEFSLINNQKQEIHLNQLNKQLQVKRNFDVNISNSITQKKEQLELQNQNKLKQSQNSQKQLKTQIKLTDSRVITKQQALIQDMNKIIINKASQAEEKHQQNKIQQKKTQNTLQNKIKQNQIKEKKQKQINKEQLFYKIDIQKKLFDSNGLKKPSIKLTQSTQIKPHSYQKSNINKNQYLCKQNQKKSQLQQIQIKHNSYSLIPTNPSLQCSILPFFYIKKQIKDQNQQMNEKKKNNQIQSKYKQLKTYIQIINFYKNRHQDFHMNNFHKCMLKYYGYKLINYQNNEINSTKQNQRLKFLGAKGKINQLNKQKYNQNDTNKNLNDHSIKKGVFYVQNQIKSFKIEQLQLKKVQKYQNIQKNNYSLKYKLKLLIQFLEYLALIHQDQYMIFPNHLLQGQIIFIKQQYPSVQSQISNKYQNFPPTLKVAYHLLTPFKKNKTSKRQLLNTSSSNPTLKQQIKKYIMTHQDILKFYLTPQIKLFKYEQQIFKQIDKKQYRQIKIDQFQIILFCLMLLYGKNIITGLIQRKYQEIQKNIKMKKDIFKQYKQQQLIKVEQFLKAVNISLQPKQQIKKIQIQIIKVFLSNLTLYPQMRKSLKVIYQQVSPFVQNLIKQIDKNEQFSWNSAPILAQLKTKFNEQLHKITQLGNFIYTKQFYNQFIYNTQKNLLQQQNKKKLIQVFKSQSTSRTPKQFKIIYKATVFDFLTKYFYQFCSQTSKLLIIFKIKGQKNLLYAYSQEMFDKRKTNGVFGGFIKDNKQLSFIYNGQQVLKLKNKDKALGVSYTAGPIIGQGDILIRQGNIDNQLNYPKSYIYSESTTKNNKKVNKATYNHSKIVLDQYQVYQIKF